MAEPSEILRNLGDVYELKNEDYGESWKLTGLLLYFMANEQPVTLETPNDWIRVGLYTRRMDKLVRSFHGEFVSEDIDLINFESIADTHRDESVYAAMHSSLFGEE